MEEDIEPQDQAKNHSTVTDRHFQPGINTDGKACVADTETEDAQGSQ